MKTLLRRMVAALWLAVVPLAQAEVPLADAEAVMRESGLWQQLGGIAPQVSQGFLALARQAGLPLSEAEGARVTQVLEAAYAADRLRAICRAHIAQGLDARRLAGLKRWYGSALGRRIAQLEEAMDSGGTDPQAALQQGAALLAAMPAARKAVLADMLQATGAVEFTVQLSVNAALASREGLASVAPDLPGPSATELKAALVARRPDMVQTMSGLLTASFARTYEAVSTDDLRKYLAMLKSDTGRHVNGVMFQALDAALTEAAREMGQRLPGTKDRSNT